MRVRCECVRVVSPQLWPDKPPGRYRLTPVGVWAAVGCHGCGGTGMVPETAESVRVVFERVARSLSERNPAVGVTSGEAIVQMRAGGFGPFLARVGMDLRALGAVFRREGWHKTGKWRPTGSHGRPQPAWRWEPDR